MEELVVVNWVWLSWDAKQWNLFGISRWCNHPTIFQIYDLRPYFSSHLVTNERIKCNGVFILVSIFICFCCRLLNSRIIIIRWNMFFFWFFHFSPWSEVPKWWINIVFESRSTERAKFKWKLVDVDPCTSIVAFNCHVSLVFWTLLRHRSNPFCRILAHFTSETEIECERDRTEKIQYNRNVIIAQKFH